MLLSTRRGLVIRMQCHCYLGFCPSCVFWVVGPFQGPHWKRHESASINEMRRLISLRLTARGRTVAAFIQLRCLYVYCHNVYMYSTCVCVHKMNECVSSEKRLHGCLMGVFSQIKKSFVAAMN